MYITSPQQCLSDFVVDQKVKHQGHRITKGKSVTNTASILLHHLYIDRFYML